MTDGKGSPSWLAIELPTERTFQKLVIWVTGGKGGTGKTTFARGVLDILISAGLNVAAFDGDPENAQLFRYYKQVGNGVIRTGLAQRNGGDDILEVMAKQQPDVVLVDVAAGGSQILVGLQDDSLFLSDAAEMGYAFTVVTVMGSVKNSINMVKEAMRTTEGYDVRQVAVKNLHATIDGDDFSQFDESKTKQLFEEAGGVVLEMRNLFGKTYGQIDRHDLPFSAVANGPGVLSRGDRNRMRQWLVGLKEQMVLAKGMLWL